MESSCEGKLEAIRMKMATEYARDNLSSSYDSLHICSDCQSAILAVAVLIKMRNDLKQPTTSKKRPDTTYNKLQWARNNLQRVTNDLKWPTMSKTQPSMTWTYLQRAKKRCETTNNKQIFRLFYNMGQTILFSNTFSTQHLVAVIRVLLHRESWWKQSIKHLLSWVKRQLSCVFFTGYKIYFFSVWVSCQQGKGDAIILTPLFHFPLLCKSFGLQRLHLLERFNDERGLYKRIQEPYYIFLLSKPL